MKFNNRENECVTLNDGRTVWLSRSIAIVGQIRIIVNGKQYVLMGKRGEGCPDEVGKWAMPCGYLDWDETLKEAVIRETWEETGLNLIEMGEKEIIILSHMDKPWRIHTDINDSSGRQNISMHYAMVFNVDKFPTLSNENCEEGEVDELLWVPLDNIDNIICAFNHDNVIKEYNKFLF